MNHSPTSTSMIAMAFLFFQGSIVFSEERKAVLPIDPHATAKQANIQSSPVIIRFSHSIWEPLAAQAVEEDREVRKVILGTNVTGTTHTKAATTAAIMENSESAAFVITLRGTTTSKSIGRNGPAIIYSHTSTDFICTRQVAFDAQHGFVASPCEIKSQTTLVYDGFASTRGGLLNNVISRIAQRRAEESFEIARCIAGRDNENEVRQKFERVLDQHFADLNRRLFIVQFVKALFGDKAKVKMTASSEAEFINLGICREGTPAGAYHLPAQHKENAAIQLWIHASLFGDNAATVVNAVDKLESNPLLMPQPLVLLQAWMLTQPDAEKSLDIKTNAGWFVVSMKDSAVIKLVASPTSTPK